jgi:hypothetical protein
LAATFVERGGQGSRVRYRISRWKEEAGPSTGGFIQFLLDETQCLISAIPTPGKYLSLDAEQHGLLPGGFSLFFRAKHGTHETTYKKVTFSVISSV